MSRPKYTIGETVTVLGLKDSIVSGRIVKTFVRGAGAGVGIGYSYNLSLVENGGEYIAAYNEEDMNFFAEVDNDGVALGVEVDE